MQYRLYHPALYQPIRILVALLAGIVGSIACAQGSKPAPAPTTSIFMARMGQHLQAPYTGTYHMLEFFQVRGKWIYPDIGYVDCATNTYHEYFAGAGRTLADHKKFTIVGEGYFVQDAGSAARSARYLWANPLLDVRFAPKFTWQTSYFSYIPLNHSAYFQQMLERSKLEYAVAQSIKAGGGYGAYEKPGDSWQNQPFGTITFSTRIGSLELWIQHVPAGAQVQARYTFTHAAQVAGER